MADSTSTPPLSDLSLLAESAHLAESLLNSWLAAQTEKAPSIDEINKATRALWRLTAVRKTLHLLSVQTEGAKPRQPPTITDEEMEEIIREFDRMNPRLDDPDDDDPAPTPPKNEPPLAPPESAAGDPSTPPAPIAALPPPTRATLAPRQFTTDAEL